MYRNKKLVRNGRIFYFGNNGVRFNGGFKTIRENGAYNTYYFQKNGQAKKGWLRLNGKKYYFYPLVTKQVYVQSIQESGQPAE